MYQVSSETIDEQTKSTQVPFQEWRFQITNGNEGEMTVSDPLLDNITAATERANSEFLRNSYKLREIRFTTYRTDFTKNMVINVRGLPYLVKGISTAIDGTSIKTTIRAVRYE
jgi:hypothetical protein